MEEFTKPNYILGYDQYIHIKSDHDTIDKKYDYTGSNGINYTWSDVLGLRLWNKWFRNLLIQVNNWGSAQDISKIYISSISPVSKPWFPWCNFVKKKMILSFPYCPHYWRQNGPHPQWHDMNYRVIYLYSETCLSRPPYGILFCLLALIYVANGHLDELQKARHCKHE